MSMAMMRLAILFIVAAIGAGCGPPSVRNSTEMHLSTIDPLAFPATQDPLVIRTDYSSDDAYSMLLARMSAPSAEGFRAYLTFASDTSLSGRSAEEIIAASSLHYEHFFLFVMDSTTFHHPEHPILCLGLKTNEGKSLRVIPSEMCAIENNLSTANMDFEDFVETADPDGVYRGVRMW